MDTFFYSDEQANKLIDCEYLCNSTEWRKGKFVKRGKKWVTILIPYRTNEWLPARRHVNDIKVKGQKLEYLFTHEFTNPKNPFKSV